MVRSFSLRAVFTFLKRAGWPALVLAPALALLTAAPSYGDVIYTGSSVVFSGSNGAGLAARATFMTSGSNVLKLLLENISSSPTMSPAELLTSDPLPVSAPVLMRELGNSPRGVSEGGA